MTYTPEQMRTRAAMLYDREKAAEILRQGADAVDRVAKLEAALKDIINCEDGDWDFCVKMIAEPALKEPKP